MTMYSEPVDSYSAVILFASVDKVAQITAFTASYSYAFVFHRAGSTLPANSVTVSVGKPCLVMHAYFEMYASVLDLLRNEKPVNAFFRDDSKTGHISVAMEPVGDEETTP